MGYHYNLKPTSKRQANPIVIAQLERVIDRIEFAIKEYQETALPNTLVDHNITNAIHTLRSVKKDLHLG